MNYGAGDVGTNRAYNADYNANTNASFIRINYPQMRAEPNVVTYGSSQTPSTADYSSNGLLQILKDGSVNWRIYDVIVESEL
jgi:hypothetical protein